MTRSRKFVGIAAKTIRGTSGKFRVVLALAQALTEAGHEVEVIAGEIARPDVARIRAVNARPRLLLPFGNRLARKVLGRSTWTSLFTSLARRRGYDLLIGNGELLSQDVLILHNVVLREAEAGSPASADKEADSAAWQANLLRERNFRLLIANSGLMQREITALYGVPAGQVEVVHPGFDQAQFSLERAAEDRAAVRQQLGIGPGDPVVAFVTSGSLRMRGGDILADACALLPPDLRSRLRVLVLANGRNQRWMAAEFGRHGLEPMLVATDKVRDVERYYHAADLLAHPARFETFSLIVEEAAASGCPVVAPVTVGATERFHGPSRDGVIAAPEPDLLAARLAELLTDPPRLAALARAQHADVRDNTAAAYGRLLVATIAKHGLV